jgi:transcription regulator MmyB-like protein
VNPYNRRLTDLVGELSTHGEPFRTWWATHNVRLHNSATKLIRHPVVGDIEVTGQALTVPADPGLTIIAYTVEPAGSAKRFCTPGPLAPSTPRSTHPGCHRSAPRAPKGPIIRATDACPV